ncbi:MAG: type IV pilus secretin PilQ [Desulfamplus sp.]|nr:type IV pilus secretin PilQ [Desulfamplus sp.]
MGCITAAQLGQKSANNAKIPNAQVKIESIDMNINSADEININIIGSGKVKYSAVKQDFPLGVMLYLHDAIMSEKFKQPSVLKETNITSLSASYVDNTKNTIAVKILLSENLSYQVQENNNTLIVIFYKKGSETKSGENSPPSSFDEQSIGEDDIFQQSGQSKTIESSQPITPISNNSPILAKNQDQEPLPVNYGKRALVTGIDFHSGDDGESSIVVKTSNPIRYDMQRNDSNNELRLNLYNTKIPEYYQRQLITTYFNSAVDKIIPIDRSGNEDPSRIHIVLREKVPYHILQEQNHLTLFLEPSSVKPMKLEDSAPIIISSSTSSVIAPLSNTERNTTHISPEELKKDQKLLKTNNTQQKKMASEDSVESQDDPEPEDLEVEENLQADTKEEESDQNEDNFFDETPVYTGEEISLDFYETDIKNVFRILQTVSGENFAVDKDVTGTVTLTLEKPAPWDEILNLILKMNGLGKIKEGSIVRIATMETIKKEQDEKAALFAAKAQASEQKKQQEPMFTEYIPINYANAESDIKLHIEKLLTPARTSTNTTGGTSGGGGTISIDKRTNMVILTDTKKVISQAKELIYTLDKVTPQIMISARIVEVTKDFSRDLGVDWGMSSQDVYREDISGLYGFDIAMNHPVSASSGIGYTFNRLAGTPLLLDARLTASELTGDTKIISSPKILTLDNKTAKIDQGLEYGYQSGVDENGNPVIAFKPVKLSLEVTPGVTPDKRVKMTLKISKNEVSGTVAGIPSVSTSEANTELLVNDGNTIVIGGIVKSAVSESRSGFPLLSNIPYLGQIFRSDTNADKKNELLIFITPTIVQLDQIRQ